MREIGVAVSPDRVTVARLDGRGEALSVVVPIPLRGREGWDEVERRLGDAVACLLPGGQVTRLCVHVALLPPLVRLRCIALPRLRDHELRTLLTRDVPKYFPGVHGAQVVGHVRAATTGEGAAPVIVAAAPQLVVEELERIIGNLGWLVGSIGPAQASWASRGTGDCTMTIGTPAWFEEVHVVAGRLADVRRKPRHDAAARGSASIDWPQAVQEAARGAGAVRIIELASARTVVARETWARATGRRLWLASAACLLVALGLVHLDEARELAWIREARAAQHSAVEEGMALFTLLEGKRATLEGVAAEERTAPRWTRTLATLAHRLPPEAWITNFRGTGDSLMLEGTADEAGTVFTALQRAEGVVGLQATAPIRQLSDPDGERIGERFSLVALLERPSPAALQAKEIEP